MYKSKNPDKDDNKKLTRVILYIRDTQDITLTIGADDNPHWWVDSSYSVHPDIKSHTGILMSIGKNVLVQPHASINWILRVPLKQY